MIPKDVYDILVQLHVPKPDLHHANTVTTSCTFLENGALLSRGYVETHRLEQTPQASDAIDKKYGIWDAVFLDHVDIHFRAGRKKGPNQYGPVLFVLDLDVLLHLPTGTDVRVTRTNPVHWTDKQKDEERWYADADELRKSIGYGDFDKMLVIQTPDGKIDFPNRRAQIALDDPKRQMSTGADAYHHAERRLKAAAEKGEIIADISPHQCQSGCICVAKYAVYPPVYFNSKFV
jgi:hypothetical protein